MAIACRRHQIHNKSILLFVIRESLIRLSFYILQFTHERGESMRSFEMSSKEDKNGKRHFKAVLYKIHPDSCVDESNQVGTEYQKNGITWIREYCEKALPSIEGMFLRCEFLDDERTEIHGHGLTDIIDDEPVFEDATTIGVFTKGYIDEVETDDGLITACIGEGEIDSQCYHNFVEKLEAEIASGNYPSGSVEIKSTKDNDSIVYKYGYKEKGRIPMEFIHSGFAIIAVQPADDSAKLIELNEKQKEDMALNETEIKAIVSQAINEFVSHQSEVNECKADCEKKIVEKDEAIERAVTERNEIAASAEQIQKALDDVREEYKVLDEKYNELWAEKEALQKALGEAKAKERISEFSAAIQDFSDNEKEYAKAEIDAFMADPISSEINSVVNKIWEGIGKAAKAEKTKVAEQNEMAFKAEDIFSGIEESSSADEFSIF